MAFDQPQSGKRRVVRRSKPGASRYFCAHFLPAFRRPLMSPRSPASRERENVIKSKAAFDRAPAPPPLPPTPQPTSETLHEDRGDARWKTRPLYWGRHLSHLLKYKC
uniref:Uncharacterized protein n=1 Tax=Mesocestoides corti TaxID=53468 RepID=A0A5K3FWZ6_MESCO